jgi:hypothetical protein
MTVATARGGWDIAVIAATLVTELAALIAVNGDLLRRTAAREDC